MLVDHPWERVSRETIPRGPIERSARKGANSTTPLLKPKCNIGFKALISNRPNPIHAIRAGFPFPIDPIGQTTTRPNIWVHKMVAGFPANDDPIYSCKINLAKIFQNRFDREEPGLGRKVLKNQQPFGKHGAVLNRHAHPNAIWNVSGGKILSRQRRTLGEDLITMLRRGADGIEDPIPVFVWDSRVEKIRHRVGKNQSRDFDLERFHQFVRAEGQAKTIREGPRSGLVLGDGVGIAVIASRADFGTSRKRIPRKVCPIDFSLIHDVIPFGVESARTQEGRSGEALFPTDPGQVFRGLGGFGLGCHLAPGVRSLGAQHNVSPAVAFLGLGREGFEQFGAIGHVISVSGVIHRPQKPGATGRMGKWGGPLVNHKIRSELGHVGGAVSVEEYLVITGRDVVMEMLPDLVVHVGHGGIKIADPLAERYGGVGRGGHWALLGVSGGELDIHSLGDALVTDVYEINGGKLAGALGCHRVRLDDLALTGLRGCCGDLSHDGGVDRGGKPAGYIDLLDLAVGALDAEKNLGVVGRRRSHRGSLWSGLPAHANSIVSRPKPVKRIFKYFLQLNTKELPNGTQ